MQKKFVLNDENQRRRLQEYIFGLEEASETVEALSSEHQSLKHSMEILMAVLEGSLHGIILLRDNKFVWLNEGFTKVLGWEFADLSGAELERIFPDQNECKRVQKHIFSDLQEDKTVNWNYDFLHKDGHRVACSLTGRPVDDSDFSKGVVLVFSDITEKLKAEELLLQNERTKAILELSNGVAHNFNNLLQVIMGNCQLAQTKIKSFSSPEQILNHLDQIMDSARYGSETVKRLQNFSRHKWETPLGSSLVVDLSEMADHAALMTKPLWQSTPQKHGFTISLSTEFGDLCVISGHKNEIFEVIINLIKNAVEAMPKGGDLFIRTLANDGQVLLEVKDTGTGIKKENLPKVFQPFWTTKAFIGTGMGLASSYGIVQRHQGTINITSQYGNGTSVVISFPQFTGKLQETQSVEPELKTHHLNVLLIDDLEPVTDSLKEMLSESFGNILTANSGHEGIEIFNSKRIDLILCDLGMPGFSGIQMANRVEDISREKGVVKPKFVLLTGWDVHPEASDAKILKGVDKVLQKPITQSRLLEEINSLLD